MTKLTVKKCLDLENFNPLNIEIDEFQDLCDAMPRDANLDIPQVEILAARFLRAADRCSEILSTLILVESKAKSNLNTIKNRLFLSANEEGYKTVREKEAYAESHETFIIATNNYNEAYASRKFFELKHRWFIEAHNLMKQRLKGEYKHQMASGFSETVDISYGEKNWVGE